MTCPLFVKVSIKENEFVLPSRVHGQELAKASDIR